MDHYTNGNKEDSVARAIYRGVLRILHNDFAALVNASLILINIAFNIAWL